MAKTRRKSISDIISQADRIMSNAKSEARKQRAAIVADRYTDNIMGSKTFKRDDRFRAYDRKYSRNAYMGMSRANTAT